jgi:NTE family protein
VNHFIVSQSNPHVLPFMHSSDPQAKGLTNAVRHALYDTVQMGARNLLHLGRAAVPAGAQRLRQGIDDLHGILAQDYRGNITILPQLDFRNYARVVRNPSDDDVLRMIRQGERATWPRLRMVHDQTVISRTIAECRQRLDGQSPSLSSERASA